MDQKPAKARTAWNDPGHAHFMTYSCFKRLPLLARNRTSGQNMMETEKGINALRIAALGAKGELDPLVSANVRLAQSLDKLDAKFENIITDLTSRLLPTLERIANFFDGLSTNQILGFGAGAVAAPTALRLGAKGLGSLLGGGGAAAGGVAMGAGMTAAVTAGAAVVAAASVAQAGVEIDRVMRNRVNQSDWAKTVDEWWGPISAGMWT